jgi:hypothetical protein
MWGTPYIGHAFADLPTSYFPRCHRYLLYQFCMDNLPDSTEESIREERAEVRRSQVILNKTSVFLDVFITKKGQEYTEESRRQYFSSVRPLKSAGKNLCSPSNSYFMNAVICNIRRSMSSASDEISSAMVPVQWSKQSSISAYSISSWVAPFLRAH